MTSWILWTYCWSSLMAAQEKAEEVAAPATLFQEAPEDWRPEVIPFPLGFAPEIPYRGREELRFSPGMYDADSEMYFTYAFVWWLDESPELEPESLREDLIDYFAGLYQAVAEKEASGEAEVSVALEEVDAVEDLPDRRGAWVPESGEDARHYHGVVDWVDPFVTQKPVKLNWKAASWLCSDSDRTAWFVLLSPQPFDHEVWSKLGALRAGDCQEENETPAGK